MSLATKRLNDPRQIAEAVAVCVITLIVVSGRILQIDILQSFLPGMIGMKLVTATAFFLAAAALIANASKSRHAHFVAAVLASAVLILGLLSLVEEITGRDLLIDRMWMPEAPGAVETVHPGRMAANTAVCFVSLGVALLLSRSRSRVPSVMARLSLLLVGIIAVQVLIGYVFEAPHVRSSAASTPMALPTAASFVLLAFGAARQRKEEWPMSFLAADTAAGTAARSLLPAAVLITVGAGWLRLRGQELGWYGTATGTALYAIVSMLALSAVTLFTASRLHRIELERRQNQENLRRALAAQDAISAQLQRINAELEAFTYSISHDLRAPLRAVSGYSRIVEEDYSASLDDEARRYLRTIRAEAQRMGNLIDDLLAFSRTGRQSLSPAELDVARLATEVFQEIQHQRPELVLELVCGDLPMALADRSLIRQVLVNLLSNAAKYAKKEGPIRIEIDATADEQFNTYRIRDFGVGFDMRYADKLFGVFQRLHSAEEFEGTGVGLAIVERIITRHGGRVWGEGVVGEGATFYFTLPTVDSEMSSETDLAVADAGTVRGADELQENWS